MALFPAELRRVFLDEHQHLARELDALEALLARGTEPLAADELRRRLGSFFAQLRAHIDHEERLLRPLLADDDWGYQRVMVMDGDHAAQRAHVAELDRQLSGAVEAWRAPLQRFIAVVREDIRAEEQEALRG